jgi:cation diffusion facilitator family transporter
MEEYMDRAGRTARLSIVSNTILIIFKLIVGFISGAVSIISEAIHSLVDLLAAVIAFISINLAGKPADKEHPYGHGKIENVSGVIEAALVIAAAVFIIIEAVKRVVFGGEAQRLELGVAVMAISGLINFFVSKYLYRVAREEGSVALEADALHLKTDMYTSLGVGGGLLVIFVLRLFFKGAWVSYLDPILAAVIASLIIREGWEMLVKAFAPLVDASASPEELKQVEAILAAYPALRMHDLRTRRGGKTTYLDFHLTVPHGLSVTESHELCDEIERDILKRLPNVNVLIHPEPGFCAENTNAEPLSKDDLSIRLGELGRVVSGKDLNVHELQVFERAGATEVSFHIDIDPELSVAQAHEIADKFELEIQEKLEMRAIIHVEPATIS